MTYMTLHILYAGIKIVQDLGKLCSPDQIASSRSVKPLSDRFEICVVLQILRDVIGKLAGPAMIIHDSLALLLKGRRLCIDMLERF